VRARLLSELPRPLRVGLGNALFLDGRCSHPDGRLLRLTVELGGIEQSPASHGLSLPGTTGPGDYWWAMLDVSPIERPTAVPVVLRGRLSDRRHSGEEVGYLELDPGQLGGESAGRRGEGPLVAICMVTRDSPREKLERHVESIRAQSHRNWICLISDDASEAESLAELRGVIAGDERFVLSPSPGRLGEYASFERALRMAPGDAEFLTLSDQEDRWYPEKLEVLLEALSAAPTAQLAGSAMRVTAPDGSGLGTVGAGPGRDRPRDLISLLMADSISGGGALFRREVLAYAWPFPPRQGDSLHDHWIALCSTALGGIAHVDRPLYDHTLRRSAAGGWPATAIAPRRRDQGLRNSAIERWRLLRARGFHPGWRAHYFDVYLRTALFARVLELRCGDRIEPRPRRLLRRIIGAERGPTAPGWLAARSVRSQLAGGATAVPEGMLLGAIVWRHLARAQARARALRTAVDLDRPGAPPSAAATPARAPERGAGDAWLTPVLVDHFARDGSTLLMRLLATSPNIAVDVQYPYEARYFAYMWRWARLLDRDEQHLEGWRRRDLASLAQERDSALIGPPPWTHRRLFDADPAPISQAVFNAGWQEFSRRATAETRQRRRSPRAEVRYYAEKHLNSWDVDLAQLPPVRVLALLRDPRDTYVSILSFDRLRDTPGFGQDNAGSQEAHLLRLIARQRRRLRWIAELLDADDVPVIRYESLVDDLAGVATRLEDVLGVRLHATEAAGDAALLRRHGTADAPQASIGRWKTELDPPVAERITRELEPELRALGFET